MQVLSARVDLLPAPYLAELKRLQDAVAPFPEAEARAILAAELPAGAFASLSAAPVASASLGQVYRGVLASDGRAVAVKVQRPGVARGIAIDLLLLRFAAPLLQKQRRLNTDLVALVDLDGCKGGDAGTELTVNYRQALAAAVADKEPTCQPS
jgi:predicted unusual protein kinase regulating ubiquinone biosynthesis (AarF/ABC1/UbiB family)